MDRQGALAGTMNIRIDAMWSNAQGQKEAVATVLIGEEGRKDEWRKQERGGGGGGGMPRGVR